MYELQIMNLEKTDISKWDFVSIKEDLQKTLDYYSGIVYDNGIRIVLTKDIEFFPELRSSPFRIAFSFCFVFIFFFIKLII